MPDITDPIVRREERLDADRLSVTRRSSFSGAIHTMILPITADEWAAYLSGPPRLIQHALAGLSNPEREFLLTGTTQEEWAAEYPPEPEA